MQGTKEARDLLLRITRAKLPKRRGKKIKSFPRHTEATIYVLSKKNPSVDLKKIEEIERAAIDIDNDTAKAVLLRLNRAIFRGPIHFREKLCLHADTAQTASVELSTSIDIDNTLSALERAGGIYTVAAYEMGIVPRAVRGRVKVIRDHASKEGQDGILARLDIALSGKAASNNLLSLPAYTEETISVLEGLGGLPSNVIDRRFIILNGRTEEISIRAAMQGTKEARELLLRLTRAKLAKKPGGRIQSFPDHTENTIAELSQRTQVMNRKKVKEIERAAVDIGGEEAEDMLLRLNLAVHRNTISLRRSKMKQAVPLLPSIQSSDRTQHLMNAAA